MDEEQLRRLYEELQKAIEEEAEQKRVLGKVSKKTEEDLDLLRTMILKSGKSLKDLTKATEEVVDTERKKEEANRQYVQRVKNDASQFGKSVLGMAGAAGQGNTNFNILSGTVKSLSNAIGGIASSLPVVGKFLDKTAQAVGDGAVFVIGQLDKVGEAYQELGKVGAITTTGVDGLRRQFDELGTIGLPAFTKAIRENGQAVAALGSSTSRGAQMLGKSLGEVAAKDGPYLGPLVALGYSIDEITAIGSRYASMQVMMGNRNIKTTKDLTQAMVNYLKEIDEVARATGKSREQVDEENKKMQADVAFRAKMEELRATGQGAVADEMEAFARRVGGARADAFRATVTGVPLTKEAQMATILYGNTMLDTAKRLQQGGKAIDEHRRLAEAGGRGLQNMSGLLQVGVAAQVGINDIVREQMDEQALMRRAREQGKDPFQLAKEEREALEAQLKGQKNLTKDFVDSQTALADFGRNVQRLGFDFLPKAASAVQSFTTTLNDAVKSIRKGLGMAEAAPATGGAPGGTRMGAAAARKRGAAPSAPAPGGAAPGGAAPGGGATPELSTSGLRLKSAEATAGGQSDQRLIGLAHQIQQQLGGELVYFSALNDTYERGGNSKHGQGLALDFTIKNPKYSTGTADLVRNILAQAGLKGRVIDEYLNPSKSATGGHIHVELEAMAKGGITKGLSIAGEAGPEAVVPLPDGKSIPVNFTDFSRSAGFNSGIGDGVFRADIIDRIGKLSDGNQPLQESLKSTISEFRQSLQDFVRQQQSGQGADGMVSLMAQLVELQRNQNRTSEKILQVSQS